MIDDILNFPYWTILKNELHTLQKKDIRILSFTNQDYPRRLLSLSNAPSLLFYKGNADLNAEKVIAVVGTRSPSEYGKQITEQLIRQLAQPGLVIISGLAFGIDSCAHSAALKNDIPTIGVLGHGLSRIYPHEHTGLAKAMTQKGGLLTSFGWDMGPEYFHFPQRNEIVAGLCDALLVVETGRKGGSLITVGKAQEFGKKIFAVPGRLTDPRSAGCNLLISQGKAELLVSGEQLQARMGWKWPAGQKGSQAQLSFSKSEPPLPFSTPSDHTAPQKVLLKLLRESQNLSLDELTTRSQLSGPDVAINLLTLELQGLISVLPGRRYQLS